MQSDVHIRATWIKAGRISMLHMRHAVLHPQPSSPAMRWGHLVHMAILEPVRLAALPRWDGYATKTGAQSFDHRGGAWEAFSARLNGGEYVELPEVERLHAITEATHKRLAGLPRIVSTETHIAWTDPAYGQAEARIDAVLNGGCLEVKTAASIEPRALASSAYRLGYHLQLGWYARGAEENGLRGPWWVLAIESKPPYATALLSVPDGILSAGYAEAREIARSYRACEACGSWPGPMDDTGVYELPAWVGGSDGETDMSDGEMEASDL